MAEEDVKDRDDPEVEAPENTQDEPEVVNKEEFDKLRKEFLDTRKALEKANKEAQKRRQDLKKYEELQEGFGVESVDDLKERLEKQRQAEEKAASKEGDIEKVRRSLETQHQKQLQEYETQLETMTNSMRRHMIEAEATRAISQHEGVPRLLMPHIKESVKFSQADNGEWAVRVVDEDGDPRFNTKGEYMSINDLVAEMRESEDFGLAFKAKNKGSGSGADPNKKREVLTLSIVS